MTYSECNALLSEFRNAGVSVWIDEGDALTVWPASKLTPFQIAALKATKGSIIASHRRRLIDLLPSDEVCRDWRCRHCNTEYMRMTNITNVRAASLQ